MLFAFWRGSANRGAPPRSFCARVPADAVDARERGRASRLGGAKATDINLSIAVMPLRLVPVSSQYLMTCIRAGEND